MHVLRGIRCGSQHDAREPDKYEDERQEVNYYKGEYEQGES